MMSNPASVKNDNSCLTNSIILTVFAVSFLLFVIAEVIGALLGNSLSLLGDAAAMSVDVFAYLCNLYAENLRVRYGRVSNEMAMILEVIVPSFSVLLLLGVTGYVFGEAIGILTNEENTDDSPVNIYFLYGFASANFLIDILCTGLVFYKGQDILYHVDNNDRIIESASVDLSVENSTVTSEILQSQSQSQSKNLNMISAVTHVGGDTLRTISVFTAALVSTFSGISADLCDAWASIVVTMTIIGLVVPLCVEICSTYARLRRESSYSDGS